MDEKRAVSESEDESEVTFLVTVRQDVSEDEALVTAEDVRQAIASDATINYECAEITSLDVERQ